MMFLQLSSQTNHFCVIWEKPISFYPLRPRVGQNCQKCPTLDLSGWNVIVFSQITQKRLVWELSCKNIIFHPLGKLFKSRRRRFQLQNWHIYRPFYFKFEMGVAGTFFEPHSWNFGKLDIFTRCSNDISTIFWNSLWEQTCQKCQKPMCPDNTEVHGSY